MTPTSLHPLCAACPSGPPSRGQGHLIQADSAFLQGWGCPGSTPFPEQTRGGRLASPPARESHHEHFPPWGVPSSSYLSPAKSHQGDPSPRLTQCPGPPLAESRGCGGGREAGLQPQPGLEHDWGGRGRGSPKLSGKDLRPPSPAPQPHPGCLLEKVEAREGREHRIHLSASGE